MYKNMEQPGYHYCFIIHRLGQYNIVIRTSINTEVKSEISVEASMKMNMEKKKVSWVVRLSLIANARQKCTAQYHTNKHSSNCTPGCLLLLMPLAGLLKSIRSPVIYQQFGAYNGFELRGIYPKPLIYKPWP